MRPDKIRPLPRKATLAESIRALASSERDTDGRVFGARSSVELAAWCDQLADEVEVTGNAENRAALAERRVVELRQDVETQTQLRVEAEQRAGKKNVAELEAQLVGLIALEMEVVHLLQRAGLVPGEYPPPPTSELVAVLQKQRGA